MASARIARDEHVPFVTENKNGKELKVISLIQQHSAPFRVGKSRENQQNIFCLCLRES